MRTVGVEEELLLVRTDGQRARTVPAGQRLADELSAVEHEFKLEQAEIGTVPVTTLAELATEVRRCRRELITSAGERRVQVAALGTNPLPGTPTPTPDARYERMNERFGIVARNQLTCGMHVHVSVESRAHGVAAIDGIRTWLALLIALAANSPLWRGTDTGYASYRTVEWGRWPTSGPTDVFGSVPAYDAAVAHLEMTGAALDTGMIYFDARLSRRYPTVEIRVADVCPDVEDSVLIAALCRALIDVAIARPGSCDSSVATSLLRASAWRAARFGLSGELVDLAAGRLRPVADMVDRLADHVSSSLRTSGDDTVVRTSLDRLLRRGTGADLQRSVFQARSSMTDVVSEVIDRTAR
jgi:glutamate---cysteine ligase / carboxylate-amine ligase